MSPSAIRSILVATDLTPESDEVVRAAARLAEHVGARLHGVHAVNLFGRTLSSVPLDILRLEGLVQSARERLADQFRRVTPRPGNVGTLSIDYKGAAPAILEKAREVGADLIVLGPRASWTLGGRLGGTTAERVVEKAVAPCLVVRGPMELPPGRALLPLGAADLEMGILAPATAWMCGLHGPPGRDSAPTRASELWALHVIDSPSRWRAVAHRFAEGIRETGPEWPVRARRRLAWSRSPVEEILRAVEDGNVDLIAVGVRGHGALMRVLFGSVSSTILRRTDRPVLLFPPRLCDRWSQREPAVPAALAEPYGADPGALAGDVLPPGLEWEGAGWDAEEEDDLTDHPEPRPLV